MRGTNYWLRGGPRVRRRRFIAGAATAAAGGLGLAAVGCGDDDDGGDETPTATTSGGNGEGDPAVVDGVEWLANRPDLSATPQQGGTFKIGGSVSGPSLDPVESASFASAAVYTPTYNRLFRGKYGPEMDVYNPWSLELTPDLVEEWETPDDETIVLKLRDGVTYQDVDPVNGRAFGGDDVKYSLESYIARPDLAGMLPFAEVAVSDPLTVTIRLAENVNYAVPALAENRFVMLAREVADADGDFATRAVGTGPFILEEMVPGSRVRYRRNPDYFQSGRPYLDAIEIDHLGDAAAMRAAFIAGNYHIVAGFLASLSEAESLMGNRPDAVVLKLDSRYGSNIFHLGLKVDRAPFTDPRLMMAMSKAFDRKKFGDLFLEGEYNVLGPYSWWDWFDEEPDLGEAYRYDLEAAKALVAEAGADGTSITIEYPQLLQPTPGQALEVVQASIQEIGITLDLKQEDFQTFAGSYYSGNFTGGVLGFVPTFPRYAPISASQLWHSKSPNNYYGINDADLDSALDTLIATRDDEEQRSAFQQVWTKLMETPYIMQLIEERTIYYHAPELNGFLPNSFNDWGTWGNQAYEALWLSA